MKNSKIKKPQNSSYCFYPQAPSKLYEIFYKIILKIFLKVNTYKSTPLSLQVNNKSLFKQL